LLGMLSDSLFAPEHLGFQLIPMRLSPLNGQTCVAYFSPSWTAFQSDRGRYFSVIVDGVSA
jgi:hypothetical protein